MARRDYIEDRWKSETKATICDVEKACEGESGPVTTRKMTPEELEQAFGKK